MNRNPFTVALSGLMVASVLCLSGCLETTYSLVDPEHAAVDRGYVGDWSAGEGKAHVVIRNLDGHQYYVEDDEPGQKPLRMVGRIWESKGASFAQLREMPEDGSLPEKFLVMGVQRKGDTLTLRQLNDKFFASQAITSSADLRRVLEQNLENKEMYDGQPAPLTRQPTETK